MKFHPTTTCAVASALIVSSLFAAPAIATPSSGVTPQNLVTGHFGEVATALVGVATTAAAGTMQVSGSGVYNEACTVPADAGAPPVDTGDYPPIKVDGSLEGCWYTYVSDSRLHPSGAYQESGTELFVGCLNETTCGTFTTTYTFTGKFTANFEAEIHGRCHHPIVSGTGDFAGTSGIILFKDDVDDGVFYYRGNMKDSDGASHNHETDWEARTRETSDR